MPNQNPGIIHHLSFGVEDDRQSYHGHHGSKSRSDSLSSLGCGGISRVHVGYALRQSRNSAHRGQRFFAKRKSSCAVKTRGAGGNVEAAEVGTRSS